MWIRWMELRHVEEQGEGMGQMWAVTMTTPGAETQFPCQNPGVQQHSPTLLRTRKPGRSPWRSQSKEVHSQEFTTVCERNASWTLPHIHMLALPQLLSSVVI
jgi:hypothetical protein